MKKLRILFMTAFMFVFLSSFTNGEPKIEPQSDSSMTIQVEFQNPRILIDDYRDFQTWSELVRSGAEVDSALTETLTVMGMTLTQYIASQERRYESAMDYLTRRTGLSIDTIEKTYKKERLTHLYLTILAFVLFIITFYSAFGDSLKNKIGGWKRQIAIFGVYLITSGIVIALIYYLLLFTVNSDLQYINQMLNL